MEERFVNRAMRRALNFRDRGCVVCGAPPIQCDAHHLIHWIDGGPTALSNLVLLCRAHHIQIHHGHWTITITAGRVTVTRPTWAEPPPARLNRKRPPGTPDAPAAGDEGPPGPAPAWPHTSDIPWITPEETARLNPWGGEPLHTTTARAPSSAATDTIWRSPWDDDQDAASPGP
jgi:hypothetical protein